jgi:hypothetical protein
MGSQKLNVNNMQLFFKILKIEEIEILQFFMQLYLKFKIYNNIQVFVQEGQKTHTFYIKIKTLSSLFFF